MGDYLKQAYEEARENEFKNKYTGEILPFRSPYNVEPDKGVENVLDDECVLSDYVPIKDQIKMFTREDIIKINQLDSLEKELSDLDDDDLDDYITEDELETLTNLEQLEPDLFEEQENPPARPTKATKTTENEPNGTDDTSATSGGSEVNE